MKIRNTLGMLTAVATLFLSGAFARADITVSAAISLKAALQKAQPDLEKAAGDKIVFNFGASGTLMNQIENGAPVDLFISADRATAEKLIDARAGDKATERVIAKNSLVLIVYGQLKDPARIPSGFSDVMKSQKLAVGDPKVVPAGSYAKEVFMHLNLWNKLDQAGKLVTAENVAQVLTFVERGDADAGVVYSTDARGVAGVKVVATADESQHAPIEYVAVVPVASADREMAVKLEDALFSDKVQAAFRDVGFVSPEKPAAESH